MKVVFHKDLAAGRWFQLSLAEQLANICSEVGRTNKWKDKDEKLFWNAAERALELFDLTLSDPRWCGRLREIARLREVFCDALFGGDNYHITLEEIEKYLFPFIFLARK